MRHIKISLLFLIVNCTLHIVNCFARPDWVFEKPLGGDTINVSCPGLNDTIIINGANVTQDFKGLCVGDVNGSYIGIPTGAKGEKVYLNSNDTVSLNANEYYDLPVLVNNNISIGAISLIFKYPRNKISIEDVKIKINGMLHTANDTDFIYNVINDELRIGWRMDTVPLQLFNGDTLLFIKIKTDNNFNGNDEIKLKLDNNPLVEFADGNAIPIENVFINTKEIKHRNNNKGKSANNNNNNKEITINKENTNRLDIVPNPANEIINIRYIITNNGLVDISLYNLLGEKVSCFVNQQQLCGEYKNTINTSSLNPGVYTCRFTVNSKIIIVKKIIISR